MTLLLALFGCARAPLPEPAAAPSAEAVGRLQGTVQHLAGTLGERNVQSRPQALAAAVTWVETAFVDLGYTPRRQAVPTPVGPTTNVVASLPGRSTRLFVVGAHLDTAPGTPGADDNASGIAAMLELARRFEGTDPPWTLEFVAWTNEEPPWFTTEHMGSAHHAAELAARQDRGEVEVMGAWSLETIGYYDDAPGSQHYVWPIGLAYPDTGNFLGFVGNRASKGLVDDSHAAFAATGALPAEKASLPGWITGVDWSDHRSYWTHDMPAVMITDTAPFRNPHYHEASDLPDKVDAQRLARAVDGLEKALWTLMAP